MSLCICPPIPDVTCGHYWNPSRSRRTSAPHSSSASRKQRDIATQTVACQPHEAGHIVAPQQQVARAACASSPTGGGTMHHHHRLPWFVGLISVCAAGGALAAELAGLRASLPAPHTAAAGFVSCASRAAPNVEGVRGGTAPGGRPA